MSIYRIGCYDKPSRRVRNDHRQTIERPSRCCCHRDNVHGDGVPPRPLSRPERRRVRRVRRVKLFTIKSKGICLSFYSTEEGNTYSPCHASPSPSPRPTRPLPLPAGGDGRTGSGPASLAYITWLGVGKRPRTMTQPCIGRRRRRCRPAYTQTENRLSHSETPFDVSHLLEG